MKIQKGGMCNCMDGVWTGSNFSGNADAAFFNYLGVGCGDYWKLWEYPLMDEGIMASGKWKEENKPEILHYLNEIIKVRTTGILAATSDGRREEERDSLSLRDNHSRILKYATQLRNLIQKSGVNWHNADSFSTILNPKPGDKIDDNNFSITRTEGYNGVVSEVGNLNPSTEEDKYESTHYSGKQNNYETDVTIHDQPTPDQQQQQYQARQRQQMQEFQQASSTTLGQNTGRRGGRKSKKKTRKTRKKTRKIRKKTKKKTKKKTRKNTPSKKFHVLPDNNKTIWSNDYFGERQVIDLPSYKIKTHVDNLNPITGKFKDKISDEYKRRLIIQLKKHKPSRKRFHNKTKKKYNSKSIDKILSKMTNKKIEMVYKDLLLNEKSTKRN